jgi:diguanylate cyclase (GGDEF)-like protein/PAS domain S-box-containing protein
MTVHVLLVDHEPAHVHAFALALGTEQDWHVDNAASVATARQRLALQHYEMVVLRHRLPDGDCFDLHRDLPTPGVLLWVDADEEWAAARGLRMGWDDYLVRDLAQPEPLRQRLRQLLRKVRGQAEPQAGTERFEAAIAGANVGLWVWHARERRSVINKQWARTLGYVPQELDLEDNGWLRLVHSDDVAAVQRAEEDSFRQQKSAYEAEFRMRHRNGQWRWMLSRAKVLERDADGSPLRVAGTQFDITIRKEAQQRLQRQHELSQAVNRVQATSLKGDEADAAGWQSLLHDLLALTQSAQGFVAEPDDAGTEGHLTATAHPVTAHPVTALPVTALPVTAHPVTAHPATAHPVTAHPVTAHPHGGHPGVSEPDVAHPHAPGADPSVAPWPWPLCLRASHGLPDGGAGLPALFVGAAATLACADGTQAAWACGNPVQGWHVLLLPVRPGAEPVALVGLARSTSPFSADEADLLAPLLGAVGQWRLQRRAEAHTRAARQDSSHNAALLADRTREMSDMLGSVAQGIALFSPEHRIVAHNPRFLELLDLPPALLDGRPTVDAVVQFQAARGDFGGPLSLFDPETGRAAAAHDPTDGPIDRVPDLYLRKSRDGKVLEVRTRQLADGSRVRTYADVTSYVQSQLALRESEVRFRSLTELITDWYWEQDAQGRFTKVEGSRQMGELYDFAQMIGRTVQECRGFIRFHADEAQWAGWQAQMDRHTEFRDFVFRAELKQSKQLRHFAVSGLPMFDADGAFSGYRGTGRDITDRRQAEEKIKRLAYYDALCNLPNRRLLVKRLSQALSASHRSACHGALLFIDLDNFKDLNDTLGHAMGDTLLRLVGRRLVECVREADTVARLGGDEFVVMLEHLSPDEAASTAAADATARKIQAALNRPYDLGGTRHHSTPSIGLTLFRGHAHKVDELLTRADLAMYQAKAAGRNVVRFFDPRMQTAVAERSALEADLRHGLDRDELDLHYQPIVDIHGDLVGAEALLRWRHPVRGMVSPVDFIPLAERTGLILPLGRWVLETACQQLARWATEADTAALKISVNVSARQFRQPDFVAQVTEVLALAGARADRLKIELTESMLLSDVEDVIDKMAELKALGVGFALDDLGTGYSSLSYLKRLPLDQLKIDKSFVRDVLTDPNDAAIARTILTLARSMDLTVVAEGVETPGQHAFLVHAGCDEFQGYLFGRPVPVAQLLPIAAGGQWSHC